MLNKPSPRFLPVLSMTREIELGTTGLPSELDLILHWCIHCVVAVRLTQVSFCGRVKAKLQETAPDRVEPFMAHAQAEVKKILGKFKDYQVSVWKREKESLKYLTYNDDYLRTPLEVTTSETKSYSEYGWSLMVKTVRVVLFPLTDVSLGAVLHRWIHEPRRRDWSARLPRGWSHTIHALLQRRTWDGKMRKCLCVMLLSECLRQARR